MSEKEKQDVDLKVKVNDDTLIGTLHDEDYTKLKTGIENRVAEKIFNKIESKKEKIMDDLTGR